jgi:release factor glutamine methyltransferase
LTCEALGCSRVEVWAWPEEEVEDTARLRLEEMLARRIQREPVQYIVGYAEFMGLRLKVDPNVLVPRPETELLVERASQLVADRPAAAVLDIGTGSGCIALTIEHLRPEASVTACDISVAALEVAMTNGRAHKSDVHFIQADVHEPAFADRFEGRFDLIISNPPYVPDSEIESIMPEVLNHEPHAALFVSGDPILFYRAIVSCVPALLADKGWLLLEVHPEYASQVKGLLSDNGFERTLIRKDLAGRDRIVEGWWQWNQ